MITNRIKFALKHPLTVIRYLVTRDLELVIRARRFDFMLDVFEKIFGVKPVDEIKGCMSELEASRSLHYIVEMSKVWPKVDNSGMVFYKGPIIYCLIRHLKPDVVVETGVASGVSTYLILLALKENGKGFLYSIDLPNIDPGATIPPDKEPGWIVPGELRDKWRLILGDAKEVLPVLLEKLESIDVFLHDSLHTWEHMMFEFETAWHYIKMGGALISDDVFSNEAFQDFLERVKAKWIVRYYADSLVGMGIIIKGRGKEQ